MWLIIFSLQKIVTGFISCEENNYSLLVLEQTNPFYKEQFQMNPNDFQNNTDALGFGFWSQFRPYQDILESNQVDQEYQSNEQKNGDLLFSIRNIDTNQFETVYFLQNPLYVEYIYHKIAQQNEQYNNNFDVRQLRSYTRKYEGMWVYTHFQYIPLKSEILVYFATFQLLQSVTLQFQFNKYGNKEIIIGGQGKISNFFNLGIFHGRISKPIMLQFQQRFKDSTDFLNYYQNCNEPKSCNGPIKIDIIQDQVYMDSTMYYTKTVKLYENAYSFGGWVKVDFSNIETSAYVVLIRATINKAYKQNQLLGDKSFNINYYLDVFGNMSTIVLESYSYIIPQIGNIQDYGKTYQQLVQDHYSIVQNNIQQWHYIKITHGIYSQTQRVQVAQIYFPNLKSFVYYQLYDNNIGSNQFTSDYLYLHIGVDKYQINSQFKGWIQDFQIQTCQESIYRPIEKPCHYTCLPTDWCQPDKKCEQCPINSYRIFLLITKLCECEQGYYTVFNQPTCQNFQNNFQFLQFSVSKLIKVEQCSLGYYQYQDECFQCPYKIQNNHQVSCLECIQNRGNWYINPICQTDYIKLIGNIDEPLYLRSRTKSQIDLFKINQLNYLELCQGCNNYCQSLSSECFLSNHYHLGNQMIVQCKNNYHFDQKLLECQKCIDNCEICDFEGQCIKCQQQHYFDSTLQQCLQCNIRCAECRFDIYLNQQVCTGCPEYFTLYNGICLQCGVFCKFCQADHYINTSVVYARCYQCVDQKKYYLSFDGINCHANIIENCVYGFQYYQYDRHIQTIDILYEPRSLDSTIISACAQCQQAYLYIIEEQICTYSTNPLTLYSIREDRQSPIVILNDGLFNTQTYTVIQKGGGCITILNCDACIYKSSDDIPKCALCNVGFYMQKLRGNCIQCPVELNCSVCEQQQKINKDHFKLEFMAFYEWFVNFDGTHSYEDYVQSQNPDDFEIVCTICHFGFQPINGRCVQDCPENCAECVYNDGKLHCLRCYDTIQGVMQTLVNNECIQCPFNCAVCLPQDETKVYQYNPYFSKSEYSYFTNLCLSLIKELPERNYFYDPEIGNFIECGELQQCYQEVHFQMIVHCNDQSFEQLLLSSSNAIQFQQQNIKLSQLFSTSTDSHNNQYLNDIVYLTFNQKSIKKINQTFIFTNFSECIIAGKSSLKDKFSEEVYSIKETYINFIGINNNVKIYFSDQIYLDGYTNVLFQNMELINSAISHINFIIISHLINTQIIFETIQFNTQSKDSSICISAFNSSNLTMNNCHVFNLNYIQNNFINIQNSLWKVQGLNLNDVMNIAIENLTLLNCTFINSSIIHNILDNKFIFSFRNILIQAKFQNSLLFSQFQSIQFSNKIVLLDTINIESTIIDTDGFFNFQNINLITIISLNFNNSIISNSVIIYGNSQFLFNNLNFQNLKMLGNSILIKYEASKVATVKNIYIQALHISDVSYEQIHPFIYFIDLDVKNQLQISFLSLKSNYLANYLQKQNLEIFYYSALIYVEMLNIYIANSNILRMPGYYELAFVNTQNITVQNLTIKQKEQIKGLHQYLDCQQQQNFGNQYFSVISIYKANYTLLNHIRAYNLILYNYPLIQYQSIDLSRKIQSETLQISNCIFSSIIILITQDIKSSSIIMVKSEQLLSIEIFEIVFNQNQLNTYLKGNSIYSCLINIQCLNGTVLINQLEANDNLVTNDTTALFNLNIKSLILQNCKFLRNNFFDYEKIKGNLMWSFPNNTSQITIESLQNLFPIKSDGIFIICYEVLLIDNITIQQAQGCKGGAFQLKSKKSGIVNIKNSNFIQIRPSLNCDQSNGGALYFDSKESKLIAKVSQIKIESLMSLNLGGFVYVLSGANELNITISDVVALNYQSLKGSFLYASLIQSKTLVQEIHIYNCSLKNEFPDFIKYLGYLSTFDNLDTSNLLKDRVQFFFENGKITMKNITIHVLNYESFIYVRGCNQMDFSKVYFGGGNYTSIPLFSIEFESLIKQKLNFDDIQFQNLNFFVDTQCKNQQELKIAKLTLLCQQSFNQYLPLSLKQSIDSDFQIKNGLCYLNESFKTLIWDSFSFMKISYTQKYHLIKINQLKFKNIVCNKCENGLLNINFEEGKNNQVQINNLFISNSSCGTLGCLVLNTGQLLQSTKSRSLSMQTIRLKNTRQLDTLEKDYYNMNYTFKVQKYTCIQNIANFGVCLFLHNIELQVIDSYFSDNKAINSGGAIYTTNTEEQLSLIRTTLENNSANKGNSLFYQNQLLPNLTKSHSFYNYSKNQSNQLVGIPQNLKITKLSHQYYQNNLVYFQNDTLQIDLSMLDDQFYFPNGQSLSSYQYFDIKTEQYVQLNLSFRLVAMNLFDQEQIEILGTKCTIYSRMIQNLEDEDVDFTQDYTNLKSIEFNITSNDYNLDELILYFDSDQQETMFLQLQFTCNSIKVPVYLENDPYNVNSWHDQYFLRTSLIKPLPCQIGEIKDIDTHVCNLCDGNSGFYSVTFNSQKCESKNDLTMISVTSAQINLKQHEFYWRPYATSDLIESCYNLQSNCLGSWQHGDQSCFAGHIGALCEQCDLYNIRGDGQYSISSDYICGECSTISQNIIIICIVSILQVFSFILSTLLSIVISVKSTDELIIDLTKWKKYISTGILVANEKAMAGILMKILTNYLQIVGSLSTFKLQMPNWIKSVIITSSDPIQSMAYSLDCFLIDMFQFPILYSRILWHLIMLNIYIVVAILLFYLISLRSRRGLRQGIIPTILIYTIIFLQPNIVKSLISSISYRNISGYRWVQGHVAYRYDSESQQAWLPYLLCLLVLIGILIPGFLYYRLFSIREKLNNFSNRSTWGFLYNEYTKWAYYWEVVKIILKEMIIIILTYYEDSIFLKAIIMNLCILLYTRCLLQWKPYNLMFLNKLESSSSYTCSVSTILGLGIHASQQQDISEVQYPLFLILFICNARFIKNMFVTIIFAYVNKFQEKIDEVRDKIKQRFPQLPQKIPGCIKLLENKTHKKRITQQLFRRVVHQVIRQQQSQMQIARQILENQ